MVIVLLCGNIIIFIANIVGAFVGGLLRSGELFLWHKATDTLKRIEGLPQFTQTQPPGTQFKSCAL